MTASPRSLVLVDAPPASQDPLETWARLDSELARWLRTRTTLRASRGREPSPLDDVAAGLRRVRATLSTMGASLVIESVGEGAMDPKVAHLVSLTYRWAIRVARELEGIEQLDLESMAEWTHFEAFAPFALAFFDSAVAAPFASCPATNGDVAVLRREIDAVLGPLGMALTSSALAA
jgi:hypothetical protein